MNLKFLSVKRTSYIIAKYISNYRNENHAQKYIYYYALQAILGEITKTTIILLIMYILGLLSEAVLCMIVFSSIRSFGGGFHANSSFKCFLYTLTIVMSTSYASMFITSLLSISITTFISLFLVFVSLILIYKLAPKENSNRPILSQKYRNGLKIKTISVFIIWVAISLFLYFSYNNLYFSSIIIISAFFEAVTLTNWFQNGSLFIEKNFCKTFCKSLK